MEAPALVLSGEARDWPRRVGPLAWVAFEHLALLAQRDATGWTAPAGVRDLATSMGVNKDTAARAVSALAEAGLITREREHGRRFGYRLQVPHGVELRPTDPDSAVCPRDPDSRLCPRNPDSGTRPSNLDIAIGPAPSDTAGCPGNRDSDGRESGPNNFVDCDGIVASAVERRPQQGKEQVDDEDNPSRSQENSDASTMNRERGVKSGLSPAHREEQRWSRRRRAAAQNDAQGRLFDAITADAQDPR